MRYLIIITTILLYFKTFSMERMFDELKISKKILKIVDSGRVYKKSVVKSEKKLQSLNYMIAGLHPNSCRKALKKLSRYEKFHEYLDLVKLSGYSEKKKEVYLYIDSALLPFPMALKFKLERIKKPGNYHFKFDKGFLKGLKGNIYISKRGNRCLFYSTTFWRGEKSKIPDTIFEVFTETVGELAMKALFKSTRQL